MKTCGPRGTIHLLPATDLAAVDGGARLGAGAQQAGGRRAAERRADRRRWSRRSPTRSVDAELTVDELGERVIERTGPWAAERVLPAFQENRPRWQQAIQTAAFRGALCFGPEPRPPHDLHEPGDLAARVRAGGRPSRPAPRWCARSSTPTARPPSRRSRSGWTCPIGWVRARVDALGAELEPVLLEGEEALGARRRHRGRRAGGGRAAAPLLRRLRRRRPPAAARVPRRRRRAGAGQQPGRHRAGAAGRRGGRRRLAPAPQRPAPRGHRRAVRPAAPPGAAASSTTRSPASARSSKPPPSSPIGAVTAGAHL